jgi:dTDP-4-dehydrorhamnose reductase
MRVAVTGAGGRLGRALVEAFGGIDVRAWSRPFYDLDDPGAAERAIAVDRPDLIVHPAAWTDVDGCARQPDLAGRRNATAVAELARAAAERGTRLVLVSTNEVFDGRSNAAYRPGDATGPINAYGASKLEGERAAADAYAAVPASLLIVRTAWLYGPPGNDFPIKVIAAARRAIGEHIPLRLVADETGSPTNTADLAAAVAALVREETCGTKHVVNGGQATRADWGRAVLAAARIDAEIALVPASTWKRDSTPPAWGVLASDVPMRDWRSASDAYVRGLATVPA